MCIGTVKMFKNYLAENFFFQCTLQRLGTAHKYPPVQQKKQMEEGIITLFKTFHLPSKQRVSASHLSLVQSKDVCESSNCSLQDKSSQYFVKFYWNTTTPIKILYGCFHATMANWVVAAENIRPTKPDIFTIWPLTEKLADPCYNMCGNRWNETG